MKSSCPTGVSHFTNATQILLDLHGLIPGIEDRKEFINDVQVLKRFPKRLRLNKNLRYCRDSIHDINLY